MGKQTFRGQDLSGSVFEDVDLGGAKLHDVSLKKAGLKLDHSLDVSRIPTEKP